MSGLVPHCKAFFVLYRVGCQAWCRSTTVRATPCSASPFTACSWPQANIHGPPFWTSTLSFCRGLYFVFLCFSGSSCNSNSFSSSKYCTVHTRTSKCPQSGVVQWNRRRKKRVVIGEWDMEKRKFTWTATPRNCKISPNRLKEVNRLGHAFWRKQKSMDSKTYI